MSSNPRKALVLSAVACVVLTLFIYVGSYMFLRQRGVAEMSQHGLPGMLYVPVEQAVKTQDLTPHHFRSRLFAPLNLIDQHLFGGPSPILGIMFDLS